MSDYLSGIIDRSRGGTPVVKPRLQALFEPTGEKSLTGEVETALELKKSEPRAVILHQEKRRPPAIEAPAQPTTGKSDFAASPPARKEVAPLSEKAEMRQETLRPAVKAVAPETVIVRTELNPVPEVSEKETQQALLRETAPVVRVSIGRVEVKAVLPQAPVSPPKPVRQKKPVLTLDNYLKQRQER